MESYHENQVGISNGLAWTAYGGEMIKVEAVVMPGKGKLILTGSLGNVMRESAQAALSYSRAHAKEFNMSPRMFTPLRFAYSCAGSSNSQRWPFSGGYLILINFVSTYRPCHKCGIRDDGRTQFAWKCYAYWRG